MPGQKQTKHGDRAHAVLGASSSHRWMNCPGSVSLSKGIPSTSSFYADEGTVAHQVCEKALAQGKTGSDFVGKTEKVNGVEWEVTEEMAEAVDVYCEVVRSYLEDKDDVLFIEKKFSLEFLREGMFGTNDSSIYKPKKKKLVVADFKYGAGIKVKADHNPQLMYYGLGAAYALDLPIETVELVVVQPRVSGGEEPSRWEIPFADLYKWSQELLLAAEATDKEDAPLVPGDWCGFCPALTRCPKHHENALELASDEFSDMLDTPEHLIPVDDVISLLPKIDLFIPWAKSVQKMALDLAESGKEIPGYKLVAKRKSRRWIDPDSAESALIGLLGTEAAYNQKIKTPAQVETAIGKAEYKKKIADLVENTSTGNKLVPVHADGVPALPSAESDFADLISD